MNEVLGITRVFYVLRINIVLYMYFRNISAEPSEMINIKIIKINIRQIARQQINY